MDRNFIAFSLLFLSLTVLYLFSMPITVGLEDEGAFILSSYNLGIAHPPGYPLYTLLGYLFSNVEFSTVAARLHALSALTGAIACVFVGKITQTITNSTYVGILSAVLYGVSYLFWSQSIVAEVYTLNACLFFATYYCLLKFVAKQSNFEESLSNNHNSYFFLYAASFLFGLGLSNHWPLMIISSPVYFILVAKQLSTILRKIPVMFFLFAIGLTPYIWMYFVGLDSDSWVAFGGWGNFREFAYYVMREGYSSVDNSPTAGFPDKFEFAFFSVSLLSKQFGLVGLAVGLFGAFSLLQNKKRKLASLSLVIGCLGTILLLSFALGFDFDGYRKIVFSVYLLVPIGLLAILIGIGIKILFSKITSIRTKKIIVIFMVLYPGILLVSNIGDLYRKKDTWGQDYAMSILGAVPENSVLFVSDDTDTGPIGYLHYVEGVRPDITLYQSIGALYPNRLYHPYRISRAARNETLKIFIERSEQPVFSTSTLPADLNSTPLGVLQYYSEDETKFADEYFEKNIKLVQKILSNTPKTGWQKVHKEYLSRLILHYLLSKSDTALLPEETLNILLSTFDGKLSFLGWNLAQTDVNVILVDRLIQELDRELNTAYSKVSIAQYHLLKAMYKFGLDDPEGGMYWLRQSVDIWPTKSNKATRALYEQLLLSEDAQGISALEQKIGSSF